MDEKMKQALLDCCERHVKVLSDETINFAYDLAETAIKTSPNVLDDAFLPIIKATKPIVDGFVDKAVDKINGKAGE